MHQATHVCGIEVLRLHLCRRPIAMSFARASATSKPMPHIHGIAMLQTLSKGYVVIKMRLCYCLRFSVCRLLQCCRPSARALVPMLLHSRFRAVAMLQTLFILSEPMLLHSRFRACNAAEPQRGIAFKIQCRQTVAMLQTRPWYHHSQCHCIQYLVSADCCNAQQGPWHHQNNCYCFQDSVSADCCNAADPQQGSLYHQSQYSMSFYCKWVMPADNSALPFWCSVGFRFSPRSRQGRCGYQHQSTLNILLTTSKQDRQK